MGRKIGVIFAAIAGALVIMVLRHGLPGGPDNGASSVGISQERCVRQFDGLDVSDEDASAICGCMLAEFEKRDINVLEAFAGRADEMQAITRSCAAQSGVQLPTP